MRDLFEQLERDGAPAVRALLGKAEELDFDCKRKSNPNIGSPERLDKQNLGIMLSAFSNSMGGLLLWGVDARHDSGVDCIQGFEPIADIVVFESGIRTLAIEAVMPRLANIQMKAIEEPTAAGRGYLAIYVERSERRPHRCEFGDKGYFRRAGSSSRQMEHFEIEDAFRRLTLPALSLKWSVYIAGYSGGPQGRTASIGIQLSLHNSSGVSATLPYVMVKRDRTFQPDAARPLSSIMGTIRDDLLCFEGDPGVAIHPGLSRALANVKFDVPVLTSSAPASAPVMRDSLGNRTLGVRFGCRDMRVNDQDVRLTPEELIVGVSNGFLV